MKRPRRNHSPKFKAKVALDAITGNLTMAELLKKYDVHANQIKEGSYRLREKRKAGLLNKEERAA